MKRSVVRAGVELDDILPNPGRWDLENVDRFDYPLLVGHDRYREIAVDRIDHIEAEEGTRMPSNYAELMTFRQLADVVSYLESLHASAAGPGR